MRLELAVGGRREERKRRRGGETPARIDQEDVLTTIFAFLDFFDLARCSVVCKSWNVIIKRSKLLQVLYLKQQQLKGREAALSGGSGASDGSLSRYLEQLAVEHHRVSLVGSSIIVDEWRGHSSRVDQCRMKMGLILTGVGDKVMRLWSSESYKCIEEYRIPGAAPLVDFDFDESKVVGLLDTRIGIWRRNGQLTVFPQHEGTFVKGLCMRYFDPHAVVGCEDGSARVFDMYSKRCTQIIRMHPEAVTCLSMSDDQLIVCGSSLGRITVSGLLSDQKIATLRVTDSTGIRTLCYNPLSHQVFAGTAAGYTSCWDLRKMGQLWKTRAAHNIIFSANHLRSDTSTLVVGGIDGVLRVLDQNTGEVVSRCVLNHSVNPRSFGYAHGEIKRTTGKKLMKDVNMDIIPKSARPPITCLAVGMKKVVTTHNSKYIRLWKFSKNSDC